jgi:hypothetical protein
VAIQFLPTGAQCRQLKRGGGTKRPSTLHRQEISGDGGNVENLCIIPAAPIELTVIGGEAGQSASRMNAGSALYFVSTEGEIP